VREKVGNSLRAHLRKSRNGSTRTFSGTGGGEERTGAKGKKVRLKHLEEGFLEHVKLKNQKMKNKEGSNSCST
jgi:hypothetical protein